MSANHPLESHGDGTPPAAAAPEVIISPSSTSGAIASAGAGAGSQGADADGIAASTSMPTSAASAGVAAAPPTTPPPTSPRGSMGGAGAAGAGTGAGAGSRPSLSPSLTPSPRPSQGQGQVPQHQHQPHSTTTSPSPSPVPSHSHSRSHSPHPQPQPASTRRIAPKSSYYSGPPGLDSAFGTPPVGTIGRDRPRELVRIERDYSLSPSHVPQFYPSYPLELEGRISPTQFSEMINDVNALMIAANDPRWAAMDNALAVCTFWISPWVLGSRYQRVSGLPCPTSRCPRLQS